MPSTGRIQAGMAPSAGVGTTCTETRRRYRDFRAEPGGQREETIVPPFEVPLIERLSPPCVINECIKCTERRNHETLYDSRDCGAPHQRRVRPDRDRPDRA